MNLGELCQALVRHFKACQPCKESVSNHRRDTRCKHGRIVMAQIGEKFNEYEKLLDRTPRFVAA